MAEMPTRLEVGSNVQEVEDALAAVAGPEAQGEVEAAAAIIDAAAIKDDEVAPDQSEPVPNQSEPVQAETGIEKAETQPEKAETQPEKDIEQEAAEAAGRGDSWAAIKRAEKRNLEQREAMRRERQELDSMKTRLEALEKEKAQELLDFRSDPIKALEARGVKYEELAHRYMNDGNADPKELLRRESEAREGAIKAQEDRLAALEQRNQQAETNRLIEQYHGEIRTAMASEDFELLASYPDAEAEVMHLANLYAGQTGKPLQPRDAVVMVQDQLRERLQKMGTSKAVRSLFGLPTEEPTPTADDSAPAIEAQKPVAQPRTITNQQAATPPGGEPDVNAWSDDELIENAAKYVGPDAWSTGA